MAAQQELVIGMFGGGTVGGGVVEMCLAKVDAFKAVNASVRFKKICVRSLSKPRDFTLPPNVVMTDKYADILDDSEINCIIEVMGGVTDAKDVIFTAIERGKHVITANKPLIAQYMPEINALLAAHPEVQFGYEASVCGGIPIIHTLQRDFVADTINQIAGIMNGTTNYILSKMESLGVNYEPTLKEAQDLGYAEADPTADVEGHDARSKLVILTKLCFGVHVPEDQVYCVGISQITKDDFEYAKLLGGTIKLLGIARRLPENKMMLCVSPAVVRKDNLMATLGGPTNAIQVDSKCLEHSWFVGPGAGRFPTANSVVSDVFMASTNSLPKPFPEASAGMSVEHDFPGRFYVRLTVADQLGIIRSAGVLCEKHNVSIHSVLQTPIVNRDKLCFVVTTEMASLKNVQAFCREMEQQEFSRGPAVLLVIHT